MKHGEFVTTIILFLYFYAISVGSAKFEDVVNADC